MQDSFLTTVDVGQYFMTKDTEEFLTFTELVAYREYTLPGDEKSSVYLSVKDLGLMLSQELIRISLSQCQNHWVLLRHGHLRREEDVAIEFWTLKDCLRNEFENSQHWSDEMWKSRMAGGGGHKKRFQYCTDPTGQDILYLRALQGHSGRSLIDPSLQDNVIIPDGFFQYFHHVGCAVKLHSIINSGLIPGGQILSNRRTVFFLLVDPMDKKPQGSWYDRLECTASCTTHA